jgi:hypothetical protein
VTHLELLNVVLTWRFVQPGWPPLLSQSGYLVHGVGVGLALSGGHRIVPDVFAACAERGFSLVIDVKGGGGVEGDQLERMLAMTPEDLRDLNHFRIPDPQTHRVMVLYICNAAEVEKFTGDLSGKRAAVAAFDGSRFTLNGELEDHELADRIANAEIAPGTVPAAFVPFDERSPRDEVARHVLPEVVAALVAGSGTITAEGIAQKTHYVVHEVMRPTGAKSELQQVQRRVATALSDAAQNEFEEWLERPTADRSWRFKKALASDPAGKIRDLKALSKAADALLTRLGASPAQLRLRLFDESEL